MRTKSIPPKEAEKALEEIRLLTWMMREHQDQVARIAQRRHEKCLELREQKVTYRDLAAAMEVSEQAVHKILTKGDEAAKKAPGSKAPAKKATKRG